MLSKFSLENFFLLGIFIILEISLNLFWSATKLLGYSETLVTCFEDLLGATRTVFSLELIIETLEARHF